ncbi:hypothetical protein LA733_1527 [Leptospira interrogans]|nr:hypothetical protein LA733_1527 [Leptospira interrogans]KWV27802.1 hypothetical protein LA702_1492 [Leptospira interrogans]
MILFWKNVAASFILIPIFLGIAYIFSGKQISSEQYNTLTRKEYQILTNGYDRNAGNVVVIQPEWRLENFSSEERFLKFVEAPLKQAKQNGLLKKNTLVVLPPHTGSFLYFLNSRQEVFKKANLEEAFHFIKLEILFKSIFGLNTEQKPNPSSTYLRIFSNLSRTYGVYILPGSILTPIENSNPDLKIWQEVVYIFDPNKQISFKENILARTPTATWKKNLTAFQKMEIQSNEIENNSLTTYQFPFARFGIFYLDEFKNPEFQEKVKKTFVSRVIVLGENPSETDLKEWATKSNLE